MSTTASSVMPRSGERASPITQFDAQVLPGAHRRQPQRISNTGRQVVLTTQGLVMSAVAWGGATPRVCIWRDAELIVERHLEGNPSTPCLVATEDGRVSVWLSVDGHLCTFDTEYVDTPLSPFPTVSGELLDACAGQADDVWLVTSCGGPTFLSCVRGGEFCCCERVSDSAAGACVEIDDQDRLHLAVEEWQGIAYRRYDDVSDPALGEPALYEHCAEAFGFRPTLLVESDRVFLAYLGESCRQTGDSRWNVSWQRMGRGGYVAVLVRDADGWRRFRIDDSQQIVNRLRPTGEAYGGGPHDALLTRIEEFSAPSLVRGPDGVVQALWANQDRRYVYAARFLEEAFAPRIEVRGPFEQLQGPCPTPRFVDHDAKTIPLLIPTASRVHLDRLQLPERGVGRARQIDFVQFDELSACHGLEQTVNPMRKHPANPVIARGEAGSADEAGLVADISRNNGHWTAEYVARRKGAASREFAPLGEAYSDDGIHWQKRPTRPISQRYSVDGRREHRYHLRYLEDVSEPDPARRYKGLYRVDDLGPWGWAVVVSPDAEHWTRVSSAHVIRADDDLRLWIDEGDVPSRRWKATSISRSHCGRVAAMWYSADGVNWCGARDTLDFHDPFGSPPDPGGTGHILLEAWAGPADEDELHGGYLFREGQRWLLHYMKWTPDGHIYCALASSRDGMNFTRVGGGAATLPLGDPGTWEAGRVALREAPFQVDQTWRQYYTGCGWKHGLAGGGAKTSPFGVNAPNQMGVAEIEVGRWTGLRLQHGEEIGELVTVPIVLEQPCELSLNVSGLGGVSDALTCAVLDMDDPETGEPLPGYGEDQCDSPRHDGMAVGVTWRGRGLNTLGPRTVRLRVRIRDWRVQLHALHLTAQP